jgi:hypothetical protein
MKKSRFSIKGKGADAFLAQDDAPAQAGRQAKEEKRKMVTFYLSPTLVEKLDDVWLDRRRKDRSVQKSHIVEEALSAYLK